MRNLYVILTVVGWVWTVVFFIACGVTALRRKRQEVAKGSQVVPHE